MIGPMSRRKRDLVDATPYAKLSLARKQAVSLERLREPALACPKCQTQTTTTDLLRHVQSCTGPLEPHPSSRWITRREARDLGVSNSTLSWWARRGDVRFHDEPNERRYLLRDLALRVAQGRKSRTHRRDARLLARGKTR